MILKYPLGLLALLGIPIVILIYIIKSKYTEQTIASTYLWRLSEKFLKNKRPKSKLNGLISLILQISAIIAAALIISEPVIKIPNAAKEYCFILDASGSMNMETNGESRLELGKDKIEEIINESYNGSSYTVISCKDKPEVLFEGLKDKKKTIELINNIDKTDLSGSCVDSLGFAQYYFNKNRSIITYLVTDKDYEVNNINLINVSANEENYALIDVKNELAAGGYEVSGKVISYVSDANLEVALYLDDKLIEKKSIECKASTPKEFNIKTNETKYKTIDVKILNEDGLKSDNEQIFYNILEAHDYKVLLVSDKPSYLKNVLKPNQNLTVEVMSIADYDDNPILGGYSLYIFDSYEPNELPSDGTLWIFNPTKNLEGSGFTVQENVDSEKPIVLNLNSKSSHSLVKKLTNGLIGTDVYVKKYNKIGLTNRFTVLYDYEGLPMIFTGSADKGNREVVFAFDLHDSNFPLQLDYITLSKNLIDYSFPIIIDEASYKAGDKVILNVLPGCDSIKVIAPSGRHSYIDASGLISEYTLAEVGTYEIIMRFGDNEKVFNIFSRLDNKESFDNELESLSLEGDSEDKFMDGIYDKLIALFIILAIVYIADWMVYCYEQYQLR